MDGADDTVEPPLNNRTNGVVILRYPALIDGEKGAYSAVFPDMDGVVAMGATVDEAIRNAEDSLLDYARSRDERGEQLAVPSAQEDVEVPAG